MIPASAVPPPTAIGGLTVDCDDAGAMVAFYTEAFDAEPEPAFPETPCVRVDGLLLIFRESPGRVRPTWPGSDMQMHFEVFVDDLDRQEARLIALGATKPPEQDETDPTLTVLLDPRATRSASSRARRPHPTDGPAPRTPQIARSYRDARRRRASGFRYDLRARNR